MLKPRFYVYVVKKYTEEKKIKNEFPIDNNLNINFWAFSIIWIKNKLTQL